MMTDVNTHLPTSEKAAEEKKNLSDFYGIRKTKSFKNSRTSAYMFKTFPISSWHEFNDNKLVCVGYVLSFIVYLFWIVDTTNRP